MKRILALCMGLGVAFIAMSDARADETPPMAPSPETNTSTDNRARAQQLFDSALADAVAGNFGAACPKFLASQEADPKTSTLLNLANCYEKNGQTASAWGAFREAETRAKKANRADWESQARTRAEALEPKLLRVSIIVNDTDKVPGLVVSRDGARLAPGEWSVPIPVDPGDHVISASAEGYQTWETHVPVHEPNTMLTVQVPRLVEVVQQPPLLPSQQQDHPDLRTRPLGWSTWKTVGAITAGVGVVGLITSGIIAIVAKGNYNDARAQCQNGTHACPPSAVDDSNSAYQLATGGTVAFVAGAVFLASGAALFLFNYNATSSEANVTNRPKLRPQIAFGVGHIAGTW